MWIREDICHEGHQEEHFDQEKPKSTYQNGKGNIRKYEFTLYPAVTLRVPN